MATENKAESVPRKSFPTVQSTGVVRNYIAAKQPTAPVLNAEQQKQKQREELRQRLRGRCQDLKSSRTGEEMRETQDYMKNMRNFGKMKEAARHGNIDRMIDLAGSKGPGIARNADVKKVIKDSISSGARGAEAVTEMFAASMEERMGVPQNVTQENNRQMRTPESEETPLEDAPKKKGKKAHRKTKRPQTEMPAGLASKKE